MSSLFLNCNTTVNHSQPFHIKFFIVILPEGSKRECESFLLKTRIRARVSSARSYQEEVIHCISTERLKNVLQLSATDHNEVHVSSSCML